MTIQQCIVQWCVSFSGKKEHRKDCKKPQNGACLCLHMLRVNIGYMQMKKSFGLCEMWNRVNGTNYMTQKNTGLENTVSESLMIES